MENLLFLERIIYLLIIFNIIIFILQPYFYIPIITSISCLLVYYYYDNVTNYLAIILFSGLGFEFGFGFGGSIGNSEENISLKDFSDSFKSPESSQNFTPSNSDPDTLLIPPILSDIDSLQTTPKLSDPFKKKDNNNIFNLDRTNNMRVIQQFDLLCLNLKNK
jgi:hypothetical protein